jgi:hypothetical protein
MRATSFGVVEVEIWHALNPACARLQVMDFASDVLVVPQCTV